MTHKHSFHFNKELQIAIKRHNIIHATLLKALYVLYINIK